MCDTYGTICSYFRGEVIVCDTCVNISACVCDTCGTVCVNVSGENALCVIPVLIFQSVCLIPMVQSVLMFQGRRHCL